ncbi:NUDIX hydrolase [Nocardioides sp. Kera G14]|uniref:NUDIX hydrolase n=1 Tax=Nocardioides sp. Kera G14 TaxID=2884264 RepID=UPI001D12BD79|nr:NUDIX domain-containing protein [Nocardioides sp. Kera G14]UDY23210.1 NUDIX domain-containing protein [Nocardioides sp. Kera G14]
MSLPDPAPEPALPHYTDYDTRLAAYAVIVQGEEGSEQMLLALWNEETRKRWTLPGGGVELHESPEEGCVREVREETGYDVELTGLLGIETDVFSEEERARGEGAYGGRSLKAVRVFYSAEIVGGELRPEVDGTTDEARWWPLAETDELPRVSMVDTGLRLLRGAGIDR